jgi:fluoroquinolone resistance protein
MSKELVFEESYLKYDFVILGFTQGEYDNCTFENCNFSDVNLSGSRFSECTFKGCNMSMVKIVKTSFIDIRFMECKLMGLRFENCNEFLFAVDFENCILNLSSFYRRKLKKTSFKNCILQETDFTESDLSNAIFDNCDLGRAIFEKSVLERTDFRTSWNYSIDPELNRIKKAMFSKEGIPGLLDKYDIVIE